ncbi:DUF2510 domain-containing protein [Nocardia nepalensis]|uniref:DUF2510 domain-containing protein n=1 Tax=Nocardia nepalensis TaxID=3375448 RepID=UPI003B67B229
MSAWHWIILLGLLVAVIGLARLGKTMARTPADTLPAGWYRDPGGAALMRYWDGASWTGRTPGQGDMPPMTETPTPRWYYGTREHPEATTILVLGILSLTICALIGPFAWRRGKRALREIDRSGGTIGGRSAVKAGYICGVIGSVYCICIAVVVVSLIAFAAIHH